MLMAEKASLVAGGASGASKHAAVRQEPRQQAPGQPAEGTRNQEEWQKLMRSLDR
jgi:hypothetical protein